MKKREIVDKLLEQLNLDSGEQLLNIIGIPPINLNITYVNNKLYVNHNLAVFKLDDENKRQILINMLHDTLAQLEKDNGLGND